MKHIGGTEDFKALLSLPHRSNSSVILSGPGMLSEKRF